jgi:hypothetical protein
LHGAAQLLDIYRTYTYRFSLLQSDQLRVDCDLLMQTVIF